MFTQNERDFFILYLRRRASKPSPSDVRATLADENPHGFAPFVWEYYAGMGNTDFSDLSEAHIEGLQGLMDKGFASLGAERYYINFPYREVVIHHDKILAHCPKGRTDMPAYAKILSILESPNMKLYSNSRRAVFQGYNTGHKQGYRMTQGEYAATQFLLEVGYLVKSVHQDTAMGVWMQEIMLAGHTMPYDVFDEDSEFSLDEQTFLYELGRRYHATTLHHPAVSVNYGDMATNYQAWLNVSSNGHAMLKQEDLTPMTTAESRGLNGLLMKGYVEVGRKLLDTGLTELKVCKSIIPYASILASKDERKFS